MNKFEKMGNTDTKKAEKVFKNCKVYTMEESNNCTDAIAVCEGKIVALGSESIEALIDDNTIVIDLKNNVVLPGFIEMHVHMPGNAYNVLYNINLFGAKSVEEIIGRIRDFCKKNPDRQAYYGRGFIGSLFEGLENGLGPKKERLDEICFDKPIILSDFAGHVHWLNSKALEESGITTETVIQGGIIEKNPETGELWGTLKEEAKSLFKEASFTFEEKKTAALWAQDLLLSKGITSILSQRQASSQDPVPIFDVLADLDKKGQLKIKVNGAREIKAGFPVQEQINDLFELSKKYDSKNLRMTTAKFFIDGTVEAASAALCEPYLKSAGKGMKYCGDLIWDVDEYNDAFVKVFEKGFNAHVHSIGDMATKVTVDAIETAQKRISKGHRNQITHLQIVRSEDKKRMGALNIIAVANVFWHFKDPSIYFETEEPFLGKERAENEYPLKSLLDNNVLLTSSADHPVTPDPNPFFAIQCGVTRNLYNAEFYGADKIIDEDDPKWLLNKDERVSVQDMVNAYTMNAAYALYRDDQVGSLEVDKYADMIVIDRDIFNISHLDIENTKVLNTIVEGEIEYSRE